MSGSFWKRNPALNARAVPDDLLPWALAALPAPAPDPAPRLTAVAGDASNRRYFRLPLGRGSAVVM
jgi:hypothetical protein